MNFRQDGSVPIDSTFTDRLKGVGAAGAAVAGNCWRCFGFHCEEAREPGVSRADMAPTVAAAKTVKVSPVQTKRLLAVRYLRAGDPESASRR